MTTLHEQLGIWRLGILLARKARFPVKLGGMAAVLLVVNRAALRLQHARLRAVVDQLGAAVAARSTHDTAASPRPPLRTGPCCHAANPSPARHPASQRPLPIRR